MNLSDVSIAQMFLVLRNALWGGEEVLLRHGQLSGEPEVQDGDTGCAIPYLYQAGAEQKAQAS